MVSNTLAGRDGSSVTETVAHLRIMIFKPGGLILVGGREKVLASNTEGEGMEETNQVKGLTGPTVT